MRIIHTADLHLTENNPERWQALEEIVAIAAGKKADLLVIAGDLFDTALAAEKRRAALRDLFSSTNFKTVILPGNHDYKAYREGLSFGTNVAVITDYTKPLTFGVLHLWGLPHQVQSREQTERQLINLAALMDPKDFNILLYHGELLDAFFSRSELGAEGDERYMPLSLSSLAKLPLRYVFAGHFHSRYALFPLAGSGSFIYSGSAVSITKKETGRRAINLFEQLSGPQEYLLDSFHYEEINISLKPDRAVDPLPELAEKLRLMHPQAKAIVTISGLFNGEALGLSETELSQGLSLLAGDRLAGEPQENYYDVRLVLEDDLFKKLAYRLEKVPLEPQEKQRAFDLALEAFRVVKTCS